MISAMRNLPLIISELIFKARYWLAPEEKKLDLVFVRMKKHADALGWGYMLDGVDPRELAKAIYSLNIALRTATSFDPNEADDEISSV